MMTLGTFMDYVKQNPDTTINLKPNGCGSWRGIYSEPCIFVEETDEDVKLEEWLPYCERLLEDEFYGYKGGTFKYDEDCPLHLEEDYSCYGGDSWLWLKFFK